MCVCVCVYVCVCVCVYVCVCVGWVGGGGGYFSSFTCYGLSSLAHYELRSALCETDIAVSENIWILWDHLHDGHASKAFQPTKLTDQKRFSCENTTMFG